MIAERNMGEGEVKRIAVTEIRRDPDQPRKHFDENELLALGQNMEALGQQVPVIVHGGNADFTLTDGERRWRAAQLVGIAMLDAIVLPTKPSATALRVVQLSLEIHKIGLSAIERSDFLDRIQKENGWSVSELAANLHMKQPLVSKLLAYQKLDSDVRKLLQDGAIDMEKAYVISQEPDAAKQRELATLAGLSREDLRRHVRNGGAERVEPKASKASFALADGAVVSIRRRDLTLSAVIDVLTHAVKELRKALGQNLDVTTAQRVFADRAKARRV